MVYAIIVNDKVDNIVVAESADALPNMTLIPLPDGFGIGDSYINGEFIPKKGYWEEQVDNLASGQISGEEFRNTCYAELTFPIDMGTATLDENGEPAPVQPLIMYEDRFYTLNQWVNEYYKRLGDDDEIPLEVFKEKKKSAKQYVENVIASFTET